MSTLTSAVRAAGARLTRSAAPPPPPTSHLAELRAEIDAIDASILELIERRLAIAARTGQAKAEGRTGDVLNLKPDREADVLSRLARRAKPEVRRLTLAMWREIMAAGLASQGAIEVAVWPGADPLHSLDAARRRFGASPDYRICAQAEAALDAAQAGGVAVLALDARTPWWIELAAKRPDLWIFDALDPARDEAEPAMLAVGRIEPGALARGRTFVISRGGDAGFGAQQSRRLGWSEGWSLDMIDSDSTLMAADRDRGHAGSAPRFCLSAEDAATAPLQTIGGG